MKGRRQCGAIVSFVAAVAAALFMLIALVVDGGRILTARAHAADDAQEAARAGAEQVSLGVAHAGAGEPVDPAAATAAAQRYLAAAGDAGTVSVSGDTVTVTVQASVPMQMLGMIGVGTAHVSETGSARAERVLPGGTP